jgi:hypothetical protein
MTWFYFRAGRKVSPIEFGNRQKVHRPNEDCEDPYEEEEEVEPADVQPKEDTCKEFVSSTSSLFSLTSRLQCFTSLHSIDVFDN